MKVVNRMGGSWGWVNDAKGDTGNRAAREALCYKAYRGGNCYTAFHCTRDGRRQPAAANKTGRIPMGKVEIRWWERQGSEI